MMIFLIYLICILISSINLIYQSNIEFTASGFEYQANNSIQLIRTTIASTKIRCSAACNQISTCLTLDYDTVSKRCRLFAGDLTSGSIISSSSLTSLVGIMRISSTLYSSVYNQSCQLCQQSRYQVCSTQTSTCQCPVGTYWTGSTCELELLPDDPCSHSYMCRSDLNLTCGSDCLGYPLKCSRSPAFLYNVTNSSSAMFGTTMIGACNNSGNSNETVLINQAGIAFGFNNKLYVGDNGNRLLEFTLNNRVGRTVMTYGNWPAFIYFDNRTSTIYVTVILVNLVFIYPTNKTIPPNGIPATNCSMSSVNSPTGIAVDSSGNSYISSFNCNWITKWAPNATSGTLFAGSPSGTAGWDAQTLYAPYGIVLDEPNSFLYVTDRYNYRIQRFPLNGSGIGVTVAGDNGEGSGANQFYRPASIYLSKIDGSLYVADTWNNRIQKWLKNATTGITVAGSASGIAGNTPFLLNRPYTFAFDDEEKYMYVSDSFNNRVQRFRLQ